MSKKRPTKKKRTEYIYGTTVGEISELSISVSDLGEVSFGTEMTNTYSEVTYDRPKGPKVLSRVPQSQKSLTFNQGAVLKNNFDYRCAVDTNTRIINGKRISVTGVVTFTPVSIPGPKGIESFWKFGVPFCLEYVEINAPIENFGWYAAWERLHIQKEINASTRVGMVVDSDLGNINKFNQRKMPIFGAFNLPQNVSLIYASSDAGKENIVNRALYLADSVSSQCLEAMASGTIPFDAKVSNSQWYESMRLIEINLIEDLKHTSLKVLGLSKSK